MIKYDHSFGMAFYDAMLPPNTPIYLYRVPIMAGLGFLHDDSIDIRDHATRRTLAQARQATTARLLWPLVTKHREDDVTFDDVKVPRDHRLVFLNCDDDLQRKSPRLAYVDFTRNGMKQDSSFSRRTDQNPDITSKVLTINPNLKLFPNANP